MTHADPMDATGSSTLVCSQALHSLVEQLGAAATTAFVERFIRLWPVRSERLHHAVEHCDAKAGKDAALSLSSGASMAGAHQLAALGFRLHSMVPDSAASPAWSTTADMMEELDRLGEESVADVTRLAGQICPLPEPGLD